MLRSTPVSREEVLTAAAELFSTRGYRGTSMKDVAAALGVQAPALYNHISSKEDVLFAVMEAAMERALNALDKALLDITDVSEQLRRATESLVIDFLRNPTEVTVCNTEVRNLNELHRSTIIRMRDDYASRFRRIIEEGCQSGRFRTDEPQIASYAALEMGNSAKAWFRPDGPLADTEVAARYGQFALRIVNAKFANGHD